MILKIELLRHPEFIGYFLAQRDPYRGLFILAYIHPGSGDMLVL